MENYQISMGELKKLLDMRVKVLQINTGGKCQLKFFRDTLENTSN